MSQITSTVRSVPMDPDGTPSDKSIPIRSNDRRHGAAELVAPAAASDEIASLRFDAKAFAASLPAPEEPRLASMEEVAARSAKTDTAVKAAAGSDASKPRFIGARSKGIPYDLAEPLEWNGAEYHSTTIASPLGSKFNGYVEFYNAGETPQNIMMWLVTDLPMEIVKSLGLEDKLEILEVGQAFLPRRMLSVGTETPSTSTSAPASQAATTR